MMKFIWKRETLRALDGVFKQALTEFSVSITIEMFYPLL